MNMDGSGQNNKPNDLQERTVGTLHPQCYLQVKLKSQVPMWARCSSVPTGPHRLCPEDCRESWRLWQVSQPVLSPQRNSSNLAAAYCSQMGTYAWWCQNFCYFKRRQCGCLRVWKLSIFQGWQRTRIFKEHLCVPDPAYQCETRALDGRVINALSLCNPSVLICTQTMWAPRREITSKSMAHIKSLWLLSSKFLFGEYFKKTCQINNENNHMAVIQIFPKCEMYPIH